MSPSSFEEYLSHKSPGIVLISPSFVPIDGLLLHCIVDVVIADETKYSPILPIVLVPFSSLILKLAPV
ncbi:MAG: hypothetical protein IJD37_04605, partial [Clostridia bacterium]|nr:hypothetical protein [Clostridia bacterium]